MPQLNFFKVFAGQKDELVSLLAARQVLQTSERQVVFDNAIFSLTLFFATNPLSRKVAWINQLRRIFDVPERTRKNYSAVVLVESEAFNDSIYAVCYGNAHHYVSKHADWNFGLCVAERLFSKHTVKNTREFGGVTARAIVTYSQPAEVPFEAGESVHYLKGTPQDQEVWGNSVSCGQSVKISDRTFSIKNIHEFALKFDQLLLTEETITKIPRSHKVASPEIIASLNDDLIHNMIHKNYMVNISDQQLSGVEFLFADQYTYHLRTGRRKIVIEPALPLNTIANIVSTHFDNDYKRLLKARVEVCDNDNTVFTKPMVDFIDFVNSERNYYLQDGKWFQFDNNYLSLLKASVNQLELDTNNEIPILRESDYRSWLESTKNTANEWYRERYFNELLEREHGYINFDRVPFYPEGLSVEIADAIKDGNFVHVKIGKPQKMAYLIDQALVSLNVLKRNNYDIPHDDGTLRVKSITLWMVLERATEIGSLSEVRSLILLMKVAHWRTEVMKAGLTPLVKISYLRD